MRERKFPFLKCCEWLYLGTMSAGILFVLWGFWQSELAEISAFPEAKILLRLIAFGSFGMQILLMWSGEKGYRIQAGLGLLAVNMAAGIFFLRHPENRMVFWCYIGLEAACILSAVIVYMIRHFVVLKGLAIAAQVASLAVLAIWEEAIPAWCVGMILSAFLLLLTELAAKDRKEVVGLMPLFMVSLFLLCLYPRKEEPLSWNWVDKLCVAVEERAKTLALDITYFFEGEEEFSFFPIGYGNADGLGGMLIGNDEEQLYVTGNGTKAPLYLTGAVYDVYTGDSWKVTPELSEDEALLSEQTSIRKALQQSIYEEQTETLTSSSVLTIEYRLLKTADFFHELNTTKLYFYGDKPKFEEDNPWKMKKAASEGFQYQLSFQEIDRGSDEIQELLRQQAWREDAVWEEEFLESEAQIYEDYTQLPDTITPRTYELADTITAGAENDYDKITAIVDYLNNYSYTKTPPECPKGQEFTDYFLFESKEGYCTYFATALAVLGRCEGIPTRYVQGFVTGDSCKSTHTDVMITGNEAHAWTEVYIEHVGWIRFDATPGYSDGSQTERWKPAEIPDIGQIEQPNPNENIPPAEVPKESVPKDKSTPKYTMALLEIVAVLLIGAVQTIVIVVSIRRAMRRKRYVEMDIPDKMKVQMKRLLRLGKLNGIPLSEGETLQSYEERIGKRMDTAAYRFVEACDLYEKIRFGAKEALSEEMKKIEDYVGEVERAYLADCGILRKLVYYIL